ncbi:MAG: sulfatase-like hydrolase/transferase [Spirochaetes bacterium]|nr:sulfatase-like hydrolase/transferase [Spirochaetota bacterium]
MNKKECPNILFIITDQQRRDSLGCYGADWVKTPNLDGLARDGMMFKNCYANNPVCTPSRASIFTGKPVTSHGVYRLHDILPEDEVLFTKHPQGTHGGTYRLDVETGIDSRKPRRKCLSEKKRQTGKYNSIKIL